MQIFGLNETTGDPQAVKVSDDGELLTSVGGASGGSAVPVQEQYAPNYEDDANGVAATLNKPVVTTSYSGTPGWAADDADVSVKASAGQLLTVIATNENAAARYLQIHNKASAPASTEVPIMSVLIPGGTAAAPGRVVLGANELGRNGIHCSTGVALGISTAIGTFTAATASECFLSYTYK